MGDDESAGAVGTKWAARADAVESGELSIGAISGKEQTALLCWAAGRGQLKLLTTLLAAGVDPNSALTLSLPAFDFYEERDRTGVEMLAIAAGIESDEEGAITLKAICPAIRNNQLEACRVLLNAGADPNADAGTGVPILDAVGHGYTSIVQLLLSHGAKIEMPNAGRPLLHMAAAEGFPEIVGIFLAAGVDPNSTDSAGSGALLAAAIRGNVESVRLLLAAGAMVDPPTKTAQSITDPMLKMIFSKGKLNITTPLIAASQVGNVEVVRELLKHKPQLSRTNNHGQTAYDVARKHNHLQIVQLLREAGAAAPGTARPVDLLIAAAAGDVAGIRAALENGIPIDTVGGVAPNSFDVEKALSDIGKAGGLKALTGALSALMQGGGDARIAGALEAQHQETAQVPRECIGVTALMLAAQKGHVDVARYLIERGANVMTRATDSFNRHQTALYFAAVAGQVEIMKLVLDAGADPSACGESVAGEPTETPLHAAAEKGNVAAVRLLLERGARPDAKIFDRTPMEFAQRKGHVEIVELLKNAGGAALGQ